VTRTLIGFALIVIILAAAGEAVRRAAIIEERLADAQEELSTTARVVPATAAALDESIGPVTRVPIVGPRLVREVRHQQAESAYWQGDYTALVGSPTAAAAVPEDDSELLLLSANAAFRNAVRLNKTPQTLARSLDDVLKAYAAVLKADPESTDAAYDYEYVTRLRAALAAGRTAAMPAERTNNMQGEEGEPPEGNKNSEFNVIVPLRPEERQEQMDPGAGAVIKRRG